jgi:hypothetical protein
LLPVIHERGYLIPAFDTAEVNYTACAERLEKSIKHFHPNAHVTVLTREMLPFGDVGGYANDWQVFWASPYRQTIKLEADMIVASPVDHWWTLFEHRDVVISQGARDIYGQPATTRFYRKIFDENTLPDVYNAVTYWRLSPTANKFFDSVRAIFENWEQYQRLLKFAEDVPSTDVVYAMAAQIVGVEEVTLPCGLGPNIVHMKQHVTPMQGADWTKELTWETDPFRINTVVQHGFVHYHQKEWAHE